ncbi:unnamed protein product [Didymodactylos carnosus]|uniref:Uncharacterized protein n=1 Tax=Didymodactylos carnosus TaxID=1234261 RepID=A0A8S2FJZ0_9BILA|nr:unnamed protein product [Didymodactylos carnosus]CAF4279765.1 unnamed protein product [Didymodactylos carnosus]
MKRQLIHVRAVRAIPLVLFLLMTIILIVFILSRDSSECLLPAMKPEDMEFNASTVDQNPKEAFIVFIDCKRPYLELLDVLFDSIHLFSTRPIIAWSLDFELKVNRKKHPRVIVKSTVRKICGPYSIYSCKLFAMVHSGVHYGVQLEADSVVNYNIDVLFDVLHKWPYDLPLAPRHPSDANNYWHFMKQFGVTKRTTLYIHGLFIFTYRAHPFLQNVLKLMISGHFNGANYDETAMNVMLWKATSNHTMCRYDTYGPSAISDYEHSDRNCTTYCDAAYITFHGQKNARISNDIFKRLQAKIGSPVIQTRSTIKHMQEKGVTCCHEDGLPSSIHPLICTYEHYRSPNDER